MRGDRAGAAERLSAGRWWIVTERLARGPNAFCVCETGVVWSVFGGWFWSLAVGWLLLGVAERRLAAASVKVVDRPGEAGARPKRFLRV